MDIQPTKRSPHIQREDLLSFAVCQRGLTPEELQHLSDCDECSDEWWRLKREILKQKEVDPAA
jgi:hypothetical protein